MRIMLGQLAPRVGDIVGNLALAKHALAQAADANCQLLVLPELMITGYPPEDLLLRRDFIAAASKATTQLIEASAETAIIFGHPATTPKGLTNAATLAWRGAVVGRYHKRTLPNYGVFDELRYFVPGAAKQDPISWQHQQIRLLICEDLWQETIDPPPPCDLTISINASPFHTNKQQARESMLQCRAKSLNTPLIYLNAIGGQDEIVFDGGSCLHGADGTLFARAPLFHASNAIIRLTEPSPTSNAITPLPTATEQLKQALILGIRDYVLRNGSKQVVIGLSGGIDSALCATLACAALGAECVLGVLLPSACSSDHSIHDAELLAANLGMEAITLPINPGVTAVEQSLAPIWQQWKHHTSDVTEENIQARMRGLLLMAISNKTGRMLLTTGNKSEMAVGYATLYGDMAGGFAPLKDLYKGEVYALARHLNHGHPRIPINTITKPPSAELRPDQKDSDSLPDYDLLDGILHLLIEREASAKEVAAAGFLDEDIERIMKLLRLSEYKRRQAPPGIKVSERAFGRDRRYPITHGWR
ncbi:MAG: NAD+ synthase [Mariprofundales bacterium]|nr:NAD+ synthase [Mariprofundales bacterium]